MALVSALRLLWNSQQLSMLDPQQGLQDPRAGLSAAANPALLSGSLLSTRANSHLRQSELARRYTYLHNWNCAQKTSQVLERIFSLQEFASSTALVLFFPPASTQIPNWRHPHGWTDNTAEHPQVLLCLQRSWHTRAMHQLSTADTHSSFQRQPQQEHLRLTKRCMAVHPAFHGKWKLGNRTHIILKMTRKKCHTQDWLFNDF